MKKIVTQDQKLGARIRLIFFERIAWFLGAFCAFGLSSQSAMTLTYTVTDATDSPVPCSPSPTINPCSLRGAILAANANISPVPDNIVFQIPGACPQTISPSPIFLPIIIDPVIIDGYTQPGSAPAVGLIPPVTPAILCIEINGASAGTPASGLILSTGSSGSTIRGLVLNGFNASVNDSGILIDGSGGNTITGNNIGTDPAGMNARPNDNGIRELATSGQNIIGGFLAAERNIISGNDRFATIIRGTADKIRGNYVGTNATGMGAIPNSLQSFNTGAVQLSANGIEVTNNVVSGNRFFGFIATAGSIVFKGNKVGTDAAGMAPLPNGLIGIALSGPNNIIGCNATGPCTAEEANLISGNTLGGIAILSASTGNFIKGNKIGTNLTGDQVLGNGSNGILVNGSNNTIGCNAAPAACTAAEGNLISANTGPGIQIFSSNPMFGNNNAIKGNKIGTNAAGTNALGNGGPGISITDTNGHTIGCNAAPALCSAAEGNLISGNVQNGIFLSGSGNNTIKANKIGTDITGTQPLGNGIAGAFDGITLIVSTRQGSNSNTIGCNASPALCTKEEGNIIAYNGRNGVSVGLISIDESTSNFILTNSIFNNTELGINLGTDGVTPNDFQDPDEGSNLLQNFPVLDSRTSCLTQNFQRICGSLNSRPNNTYQIQFFSNAFCSPSGYGEGQKFAGQLIVTTDGDGNADYCFSAEIPFGVPPPAGVFFTATASQLSVSDPPIPGEPDGTSEFSQCIFVSSQPCAPPSVSKEFFPDLIEDGKSFSNLIITLSNSSIDTSLITSFEDKLPFGLEVIGPIVNTCGGSVTLHGSTIKLSGGAIPPGGFCTINAQVRSDCDGVFKNHIRVGALQTSTGSNPSPAFAELTICSPKELARQQCINENAGDEEEISSYIEESRE